MRKQFPPSVETEVLVKCRRRCSLCYGLDGDTTEKEGQLAHVDRDSSNASFENAAFLCTKHHARYDSQSKQSKGHTVGELRFYRDSLYEYMETPSSAWPDAIADTKAMRNRKGRVTLEVYDRRVQYYRATRDFVRSLVAEGKVELNQIFKFAADTDEAVFLFDQMLAEYLAQLYKRAVRFRTTGRLMNQPGQDVGALAREDAELLTWFSEQLEVMRSRFAPFLRVS